ncbi:hypothetical protein D3C81_1416670 [compost metagenome]
MPIGPAGDSIGVEVNLHRRQVQSDLGSPLFKERVRDRHFKVQVGLTECGVCRHHDSGVRHRELLGREYLIGVSGQQFLVAGCPRSVHPEGTAPAT